MEKRKYFNSNMEPINDFNKKWSWPPYYMTCDCGEIISKNSSNDMWTCKKCSRIFRLSYGEPYLVQDQIETSSENTICPKCGKPLIERQGRYGTFYGCSEFPQCKYTEKIIK